MYCPISLPSDEPDNSSAICVYPNIRQSVFNPSYDCRPFFPPRPCISNRYRTVRVCNGYRRCRRPSFNIQPNHCGRRNRCALPFLTNQFKHLALVYCDPEEAPVVWDYRAHRFLDKHRHQDTALVFVCHWSQLQDVDLVLHTFRWAYTLPIDRCCSIWFDSPPVQDIVTGFEGEVHIVDQPVLMADIIRNRAKYPHHNSCSC